MVMEGDSSFKVVGSNIGTVYWMDIFSHIFVSNFVMMFVSNDKK